MKYKVKIYHIKTGENELLEDLRRVAKKLRKNQVSVTEYKKHGKFAETTIKDTFGSWNEAIKKAGLKPRLQNIPAEILLKNIENIWKALKRQPVRTDLVKPLSEFGSYVYFTRFGSWCNALLAFGQYVKNRKKFLKEFNEKQKTENNKTRKRPKRKRKTLRNVSYKLRFQVLDRDRHKCRSCGSSPADDGNVKLEIDHIIPWSKGGESVLNNLQTLCRACNIGKGNR
jgi:5-methylcytosine-specific restriction endonuclease McrA